MKEAIHKKGIEKQHYHLPRYWERVTSRNSLPDTPSRVVSGAG